MNEENVEKRMKKNEILLLSNALCHFGAVIKEKKHTFFWCILIFQLLRQTRRPNSFIQWKIIRRIEILRISSVFFCRALARARFKRPRNRRNFYWNDFFLHRRWCWPCYCHFECKPVLYSNSITLNFINGIFVLTHHIFHLNRISPVAEWIGLR